MRKPSFVQKVSRRADGEGLFEPSHRQIGPTRSTTHDLSKHTTSSSHFLTSYPCEQLPHSSACLTEKQSRRQISKDPLAYAQILQSSGQEDKAANKPSQTHDPVVAAMVSAVVFACHCPVTATFRAAFLSRHGSGMYWE